MANSQSLSKLRFASRLCKMGAGFVTALGIVATGIYISSLIQVLTTIGQTQGSPYAYISYGGMISSLFLIIAPTLFFAIILYALGTLLDFMRVEIKPKAQQEKRHDVDDESDEAFDDDHLQIVPLPADIR